MISQSERDRVEYELRLKHQRDAASHDKLVFEYGEDRGFEKGRLAERIRLCQEILGEPETPEEELRPLPMERLQELAEDWQRRARERRP